jgi:hypothetical protein
MSEKFPERRFSDEKWPVVPDLEVKTVDFEIIKRGLLEMVSRELLNATIDIDEQSGWLMNQIAFRLTQRMLAHTADEAVVTATETVPANWWSHLLLAIAGGSTKTHGQGWRFDLLRLAKFRQITTKTTFYRTCPHVHIPDNQQLHMRWVLNVNDDADKARWRAKRDGLV